MLKNYICGKKNQIMSLPTNNKKGGSKGGKNQKVLENNSKFMKSNSKPGMAKQKVRSTGANRGS